MVLKRCKKLKRLRIDKYSGCLSEIFSTALSKSSLTHLGLGFGNNDLMQHIGRMQDLLSLRIGGDDVTLQGIKSLKNPKLLHLDISCVIFFLFLIQ